MAGKAVVDSATVDLIHPLGREARQLGRGVEGDIGAAGRTHHPSPRAVVESAEAILVLIAIGSETGTGMEDGLGMGGIRFLGENRRLEHRGVTGIEHLRIDGRHPGLGLGLGLVRRHRRGGGR
jgi:hypothetical protein